MGKNAHFVLKICTNRFRDYKTSTEILSVFFTHRSLEFRAGEKVVDYIYNHRYSEDISMDQIKDKLKEFQEEFQPIVDEINSSINKKK